MRKAERGGLRGRRGRCQQKDLTQKVAPRALLCVTAARGTLVTVTLPAEGRDAEALFCKTLHQRPPLATVA